jgi:hypothetical protein
MQNAKCRRQRDQIADANVTKAIGPFSILHSSLYTLHLDGVPSRTLTSNLEVRTLPLCALSYGDKKSNHWLVSSTSSHPALSASASIVKGLGRSSCFAFRGSKWCARPVTLRIPALI